jgi:hypothetical protein
MKTQIAQVLEFQKHSWQVVNENPQLIDKELADLNSRKKK